MLTFYDFSKYQYRFVVSFNSKRDKMLFKMFFFLNIIFLSYVKLVSMMFHFSFIMSYCYINLWFEFITNSVRPLSDLIQYFNRTFFLKSLSKFFFLRKTHRHTWRRVSKKKMSTNKYYRLRASHFVLLYFTRRCVKSLTTMLYVLLPTSTTDL